MAEFQAADFSVLTDDEVELVGPEILELSGGDEIEPSDIWKWAKTHKNSELYKHFNWNDKSAAALYRNQQARMIMNSIEVVFTHEGESEAYKAFHSVTITREDGKPARRYISMMDVVKSESLASQVVANAKAELDGWRRRYKKYRALLEPVYTEVEKAGA